ncbi:MAG: hypothetical protein J0L60_06655 [Ignavibacteria bacterium]|nr:hypothetical protein [Ignavibacteria bacterium]
MATERIPEKIIWSRVDAVVNLILENTRYLDGKRQKELSELVSAKYKVSIRTAQRYISAAKLDIRNMTTAKTEAALERALMDRELLLVKAKGLWNDEKKEYDVAPDYWLFLEAAKDRDKLLGLYVDKQKSETITKNIDMSRFTEFGLEELAKGVDIQVVMLDPRAYRVMNE